MVEAERIADRHHPFADLHVVAVAERRNRQFMLGIDLQQRDVALLVASDKLGRIDVSVLGGDRDLARALDHVVVGQHEAVLGDDEAGAEAFGTRLELLERPAARQAALLARLRRTRLRLIARDVDHRGAELGRKIDEVRQGLRGLGDVAGRGRQFSPETPVLLRIGQCECDHADRPEKKNPIAHMFRMAHYDWRASSTYFILRS
jgi:hypothetical protein